MNHSALFERCDPAGVLFFGNYFAYVHQTLEAFVKQIGLEWTDWFGLKEYGMPVRNTTCDYYRPISVGDEFEVVPKVLKIGTSSVHFQWDFFKGELLCASLKTLHVCVALDSGNKMPLPQNLRSALETQILK